MKRILNHFHTTLISAVIASSISALTQAQDNQHEGLYQVEMIVFERIQSNTDEQWPNNLVLHYPLNTEVLITDDIKQRPSDELEQTALTQETSTNNEPVDTNNTDAPYKVLEKELRQLNKEAAKLNRGSYKVLFHEAWRQPVTDKQSSNAVLITGGAMFDGHYELEGHIEISVHRYLHLETDLWRSDFSLNYGQEHTYWPSLPTRPIRKVAHTELDSTDTNNEASYKNINLESLSINSTLNDINKPAENDPFQLNDLELSSGSRSANGKQLHTLESMSESPYVLNNIITLRQKRRMRSAETHYIDHPRLGMLIHITPYELFSERDQTENNSELSN
ncbi:CsiV family protein [Agaribacterium sp. ZY112]|uniref:CsiV family protein n=1 Tax=Agaribacterium sp. ZY112 TaxID=3233574 RepID=UPI003525AAD8